MANTKKQEQPTTVQITIDEVIAEAEAKEASTDPCKNCTNRTCERGNCYMSDK